MNKICELGRVSDWYEKVSPDVVGSTVLEQAFKYGTSVNLGSGQINLFENIYIPVLLPTSTGQPAEKQWINVGLNETDIAGYYNDLYGSCRINVKWDESDFYHKTQSPLERQIRRVCNVNLKKYLKLMELDGYFYNPLWNVDGTETFATADGEGTKTAYGKVGLGKTVSSDGTFTDSTEVKTTHNVSAYDSTETKEESNDISQGVTSNWQGQTNNGLGIEVDSGDDPFGNGLTDEMRYHIDKKIRQGNIGVTKTQELIESERENLKFVILEEFFKDLNKSILVEIYD